MKIGILRLTKEEYKCSRCGRTSQLVIVRGKASVCPKCYCEILNIRDAKRKLNKIVDALLKGKFPND